MNLKLELLKKAVDQDRFSKTTNTSQEACYQIIEPDSNKVWGFVSIDNTQRGPGLGGIRLVQDLSLNEISRLARVMTMKNSSACLPYGGAKAGITLES